MAGASKPAVIAPPLDEALATATASQASVPTTPREDFRVRCTSKRAMTEILELCGRFVPNLGDALPEEIREAALRDLQWVLIGQTSRGKMREAASPPFQDPSVGVTVTDLTSEVHQCWPDSDIKVLEDQFDEVIVDIATKCKQYLRKILECVIKTLKAQHEILTKVFAAFSPTADCSLLERETVSRLEVRDADPEENLLEGFFHL
ncbi:kinetochore-associated protein NSL1 homolog [Heterocephalus glaber]|uniref:Kinetochore-associated protein NSL1 homolog n=1 Tax=Heterocephalus glaber TaxID=10181 RepID=A0AAX6SR91_HETGA|nr:kinetochore-associated protein NSL1 homolog [Heterocephalus glaber]